MSRLNETPSASRTGGRHPGGMRDRLDELINPRPHDADEGGAGDRRPAPLDAAEDDPDAARVASLPGYAAGGAGDGSAGVGPPSQDHRGRA